MNGLAENDRGKWWIGNDDADPLRPAENGAPRWRPVRPWQHWRFALTVTFCWLARRHFPRFVRKSERGFTFYRCRVCRSDMVNTRPFPPGKP